MLLENLFEIKVETSENQVEFFHFSSQKTEVMRGCAWMRFMPGLKLISRASLDNKVPREPLEMMMMMMQASHDS